MRWLVSLVAVLAVVPAGASWPDDGPVVVRYAHLPGALERTALAALAPVHAFVPPDGFLVTPDTSAAPAVARLPGVVGVRPLPAAQRVSAAMPATGPVHAWVLVVPGAMPTFSPDVLPLAVVDAPGGTIVRVAADAAALRALAARPWAWWIEPAPDPAVLDNAAASGFVQGGAPDAWPVHAHGVDGRSQRVALCDTGLNTDAPAAAGAGFAVHELFGDATPLLQNVPTPLHRKVALYYAPLEGGLRGDLDDEVGHGTHVAGTLAGDGGVHGVRDGYDGVAYAAALVVCDAARGASFQVLDDYGGYWDPAYDAGARVHSNSWGTGNTAEYTLTARQHDAAAWERPDLLIVRSAGNLGPTVGLGSEALAKNVLSVGATRHDGADVDVPDWSGRGPASDGRVKPDLVAPGDCVTSADLPHAATYFCASGTSQATAVAAGAATLVRDYFARGFYPSGAATPGDATHASAALVRAVLVASARPVGDAAAPDGIQGWGEMVLDDALFFAGDARGMRIHDEPAALETGDEWSTTVEVAAEQPLRVVLAWTDPPAAPGASPTLVNDLDLELVTPSGETITGNADLAAPDRANVIERVVVEAPDAGEYTVRVRGWSVPMGPQPFAVVIVGPS